MKRPQITDGEWHIGKRADSEHGAIYGEKGEEIALPLGFFMEDQEAKANARFIAASKKMAEALEAEEAWRNASGRESDLLRIVANDKRKSALTAAGYEF